MPAVQLRTIAHSRAGDKGLLSNLSLIAYNPTHFEHLRSVVSSEQVHEHFRHLGVTQVDRYELPGLNALNFVLHDALDGGNTRSLRVDGFGKSLSAHLLALTVPAP
jgi:hypothetical protein